MSFLNGIIIAIEPSESGYLQPIAEDVGYEDVSECETQGDE